ncbi:hypothetical protein ACFV7R_25705 [Streptomyces sp. NPDC059866]|uniref:hypothetical protein n=1 Tax=Streptomyces sp. NPDC059866 TaxID=3346978 RepID=UPI0036624EA8
MSKPGAAAPAAFIRAKSGRRRDVHAQEAPLPRILRHAATGAAAAALLHAALLGVSGPDPYPNLAWMDTAEAMSSLYILAPWPLTALVLLWLAHQRPVVYARAALALLLTSGAGLAYACWAPLEKLPAHEGSLIREYLALPGALTGWYLVMALAVVTAVPSARTRITVGVAALSAVVISVLASSHPWLAAASAAGIPLLTWFVAGRLPGQDTGRRRPADAWDPQWRGGSRAVS